MGLKIAVIGGGSTYTPELIEGFAARPDVLPIDELVLHDIDAERLAIVAGLARRMLARSGWRGRLVETGDRRRAIDGADFVLVQIRVGGQATRYVDETLPLRFGAIGQETTGPGGFAKALRTVPIVLSIADDVRERAADGAWLLDFTNPVGIVSQALLDAGHRALGLCNVAIGLQRGFARRLGVRPDHVSLEHVGLNHLSWERAVRVDGRDVLPELIDRDPDMLIEMSGSTVERIRRLRALPSYYLHYYDDTAAVLAEQRSGGQTRAEDVMAIERELLEMYRDPALVEKPALLEQRGGAYYSEAAAALVQSLHTGDGAVHVVDCRNEGTLPDLAPDDVVEVAARIDHDGAHPAPVAPLGPEMHDLVARAKRYERLTIRAAFSGDRGDAREALAANPLVPPDAVDELLDAILDANRALLPQFFAPA
jgi:6-phospho-beta-glucosidase